MKPVSIVVVPALAGFFIVYDMDDPNEIEIGEPIIAWRIETYERESSSEVFSSCMPLTIDGDMVSNCIGVQNPDMTVTTFEDTTFRSLQELRQARYPKEYS